VTADCNSLSDEKQLFFFPSSGISHLFIPDYHPPFLVYRGVETLPTSSAFPKSPGKQRI